MEGNVYLCSWKKDKENYVIWITDIPKIKSKSKNFDDAKAILLALILEKLSDGEAILDFEKDIPKSRFPKNFAEPALYTIVGNGSAYRKGLQENLYTNGYCKECRNPVGTRTNKTASFTSLPDSSDGATWIGSPPLYSERFVNLLTVDEKKKINLREVKGPKDSHMRFFELLGNSIADYVGVKDFPGLNGSICPKCKRKSFYYMNDIGLINFIAKNDLPKESTSAFVIGSNLDLCICMPVKRWRSIQGHTGTKNILGRQLGVVPEEDVVRKPDVGGMNLEVEQSVNQTMSTIDKILNELD